MTCRHLPLTLSLALALLASGAVAHANPGGVAQATSNRQGGEAFAPLPVDQPPPAAPAPSTPVPASDTAERQAAPLQTQFDELVEKDGILVGRDCPECPEMVVVPAGSYRMGSRDGYPDEEPVCQATSETDPLATRKLTPLALGHRRFSPVELVAVLRGVVHALSTAPSLD